MTSAARRLAMYPDQPTLQRGLTAVFGRGADTSGRLRILAREPFIHSSTFPSEVVSCELADRSLTVLCKYSQGQQPDPFNHSAGIAYEGQVYERVLRAGMSPAVPHYYGTYRDAVSGWTWIVLEYLDNCLKLSKVHPLMLHRAAHWIGQFHRHHDTMGTQPLAGFLKAHDADYYQGWIERAWSNVGSLDKQFPWLAPLWTRFEEIIDVLLDAPLTVAHGEFYPSNILVHDGSVYGIDWESAALAAGEIDIASLTEGWPETVVDDCLMEYQQARWPGGVPCELKRVFGAARAYWHLRWLGDPRYRLSRDESLRRFKELRDTAQRLVDPLSGWQG